MILTEPRHLNIILSILGHYPYRFYGFGSRVKGNSRKLSDLDLVYFDPIPSGPLTAIQEEFEESDLPYTVDLLDWNACSPEFQAIVKKDMVPIP